MADSFDIDIPVEPPKPITVRLGDQTYTARPIKMSLGMALSQRLQGAQGDPVKLQKEVDHLVTMIFGPKDGKLIIGRVKKEDDPLDYSHIMKVIEKLVEKSTGNPTT